MKKGRSFVFLKTGIACAMGAALAAPAQAYDFEFGDGWEASWTSSISVGTSWRTADRDKRLYSAATGNTAFLPGGTGKSTIDEGNVNYGRGDRFTTLVKAFTEIEFKKGTMGGLVRAKAWYDYTLNEENVRYGNEANGYNGYNPATGRVTSRKPLSDKGFSPLLKFDGIYLLDAYVYDTFNVGGNDLQVRFGNQVLNWGESVFIQGVNQINPIDVPSFRKPGAELKEVFLPVPILSATLSMGEAGSLEAFWQIKYQETPIEAGCGNYWSVAEGNITSGGAGVCGNATPIAPPGAGSAPDGKATGWFVPTLQGKKASDSGQFGAAYRFQALDTEFGLYAMNIHSRTPSVGIIYGNFASYGSLSPMGVRWTAQEDVKVYGISATTVLFGWSVASELSYHKDVPAQLDGNDLLNAGLSAPFLGAAVGPIGARALAQWNQFLATGQGSLVGNDLTNKTQFQINALQVGRGILEAEQWLVVAEAGFQWNSLPDWRNGGSIRYGRPFIFGAGPADTYGGATCAPGDNNSGCKNEGYVSPFAWGYRFLGQLTYNNIFDTGVTAQPKLFFSHDVKGYSVDSQFNEDRMALGLGVKFNYQKKYTLELSQTMYNRKADYDPLRDRDFFSVTAGINF